MNAIHATDGYKVYHMQQIPKAVKSVYGNLTARGDKYFNRVFHQTMPFSDINNSYVAFGMHQAMTEIENIFNVSFFDLSFDEAIENFKNDISNYIGYEDILEENMKALHEVGHLPITVKTVYEGDLLPMNSPCMVIETEEGFSWLFGYLETLITNMTWKTITNATTAMEFYKIAKYFGDMTGVDDATIQFGFHDFSSRGMSGVEDSLRNGVPHLLFFSGTESVGALGYVSDLYGYNHEEEGLLAGSIKATEHSISTMNMFSIIEESKKYVDGGINLQEAERTFFEKYITEIYPSRLVGYVADTFDFYGFIYDILPEFRDVINNRDGKVVIRPDSFEDQIIGVLGDTTTPFFLTYDQLDEKLESDADFAHWFYTGEDSEVRVLSEYVRPTFTNGLFSGYIYDVATPEEMGTLPKLLMDFGYTINEKGYAELNPKIGIIYGDGFGIEKTFELFDCMQGMGLSTSNIVIGLGAGVYNWNSRDTLGIAYKATSFLHENGNHVDIFKDPKGVNKKSAKGRFQAKRDSMGKWEMKDGATFDESNDSDWITIFENGVLAPLPRFSDIRKNVRGHVENNI